MKSAWKDILLAFKAEHPLKNIVDKNYFAAMLKKLLDHPKFNPNLATNLQNGFAATGIYPQQLEPLLKRLAGNKSTQLLLTPTTSTGGDGTPNDVSVLLSPTASASLHLSFSTALHNNRFGTGGVATGRGRGRGRGAKIPAGRNIRITTSTFEEPQPGTSGNECRSAKRRLQPVENSSSDSSEDSDTDNTTSSVNNTVYQVNYVQKSPKKVCHSFKNIRLAALSLHDLVMVNVYLEQSTNIYKTFLATVDKIVDADTHIEVTFFAASFSKITFTKKDGDHSSVSKSDIIERVEAERTVNTRGQYVFTKPLSVSA